MRFLWIVFLTLLSTCLISCIEEIQWETEGFEELLVVDGAFTNEYKKHKITLTKTADYFSGEKTPPVEGANVYIKSDSENISFVESTEEPGIYETEDSVAGYPGMKYTLEIYLDEPINDENYYTATEEMKAHIELDSIQAVLYDNPLYVDGNPHIDSLILNISLFWKIPPVEDNYYRVQITSTDSLENNTINDYSIYRGGEDFDDARVSNVYFFKNFLPGDTVVFETCSVTREYYEFLDGLKKITNQEDDQFFDMSGPPANAVGNIEGAEALGYFRVSSVTRKSTVVKDGRGTDTD
ncbi:MAG: DUF4249 domain-containing protein [Bacteroidales bacterium]